tara:strand:- start:55 stop:471 length:417 start_codon:yes stop_codon:yes gene_type:complete
MKAIKKNDTHEVVYIGQNAELTQDGFIDKDKSGNLMLVNQSPGVSFAIVDVRNIPDNYEHYCFKHDGSWSQIRPTTEELTPIVEFMRENKDWHDIELDEIFVWLSELNEDGVSRIEQVYSTTEYQTPAIDNLSLASIL